VQKGEKHQYMEWLMTYFVLKGLKCRERANLLEIETESQLVGELINVDLSQVLPHIGGQTILMPVRGHRSILEQRAQ